MSHIKLQSFIDEYNWEAINYPLEKYDLNKFERNNLTIALHVLYAMKEKQYPSCVSKLKSACEKKVIIQMISNGDGWLYIVKKVLGGIT